MKKSRRILGRSGYDTSFRRSSFEMNNRFMSYQSVCCGMFELVAINGPSQRFKTSETQKHGWLPSSHPYRRPVLFFTRSGAPFLFCFTTACILRAPFCVRSLRLVCKHCCWGVFKFNSRSYRKYGRATRKHYARQEKVRICSGGFARRIFDCPVVPPRAYCATPLLPMVIRISGGGQKRVG